MPTAINVGVRVGEGTKVGARVGEGTRVGAMVLMGTSVAVGCGVFVKTIVGVASDVAVGAGEGVNVEVGGEGDVGNNVAVTEMFGVSIFACVGVIVFATGTAEVGVIGAGREPKKRTAINVISNSNKITVTAALPISNRRICSGVRRLISSSSLSSASQCARQRVQPLARSTKRRRAAATF